MTEVTMPHEHEEEQPDDEVQCPHCGRWVKDRGIDILYHVMWGCDEPRKPTGRVPSG